VKKCLVVPVSFVTEHIETLHEINVDGRIDAKKWGIERFRMMPAVGDSGRLLPRYRTCAEGAWNCGRERTAARRRLKAQRDCSWSIIFFGKSLMTSTYYPGVHRFAVFVFAWTLLLLFAGALVTSKDAALSVADWPTSFGTYFPSLKLLTAALSLSTPIA